MLMASPPLCHRVGSEHWLPVTLLAFAFTLAQGHQLVKYISYFWLQKTLMLARVVCVWEGDTWMKHYN